MPKMKRFSLNEVIAERVLQATKHRESFVATVRLGRPVKSTDAPDHRCPYQITGIGDDVVRSASGEDSIQALVLAIQMIGAELRFRYKEFSFTWLGNFDLGFPKPEN